MGCDGPCETEAPLLSQVVEVFEAWIKYFQTIFLGQYVSETRPVSLYTIGHVRGKYLTCRRYC